MMSRRAHRWCKDFFVDSISRWPEKYGQSTQLGEEYPVVGECLLKDLRCNKINWKQFWNLIEFYNISNFTAVKLINQSGIFKCPKEEEL